MLRFSCLASRIAERTFLSRGRLQTPDILTMPKRKASKIAPKASESESQEHEQPNTKTVHKAAEEDEKRAASEADKPKPKKRKPTQKQLEEAEAAARPRYEESMRPSRCTSQSAFTVVTWNVASLNSTLNKDPQAISRLVENESADAVCLQETKLQQKNVADFQERLNLPGWHHFWSCSETKKGYSGTAVISRTEPISAQVGMQKAAEHDGEGRLITLEYHAFYLVNVYTPNAGEGLRRLDYKVQKWDPAFAGYVTELNKKKPVVITGDLNCAHQPIDIHSPRTNKRTPGFTEEERESFGKNLQQLQLIDCFRHQFPNTVGYTWWSMRTKARPQNKGWRLDYFLASKALTDKMHDCFILKTYGEEGYIIPRASCIVLIAKPWETQDLPIILFCKSLLYATSYVPSVRS